MLEPKGVLELTVVKPVLISLNTCNKKYFCLIGKKKKINVFFIVMKSMKDWEVHEPWWHTGI